jgi:hypothetical protein
LPRQRLSEIEQAHRHGPDGGGDGFVVGRVRAASGTLLVPLALGVPRRLQPMPSGVSADDCR